jgi:ABC-type multidrug transport system fused ATPase/permease subunit
VTPVGKLLANFTEDIGRLDRTFFEHVVWLGDTLAELLLKIGLACYCSQYMGMFVAVNASILYRLSKYTMNGKSEANRVKSKTEKKINTFMDGSYDGVTIIRAFEN